MEVWAHACILHGATVPTHACGSGEQRPTQAGRIRRQLTDKGCSSCSKGQEPAMKSPSPTNFALDQEERKNLLECSSAAETCPAGSAESRALQSWLRSSLWAEAAHFLLFQQLKASRKNLSTQLPQKGNPVDFPRCKNNAATSHILEISCSNHICTSPMLASLAGQPT